MNMMLMQMTICWCDNVYGGDLLCKDVQPPALDCCSRSRDIQIYLKIYPDQLGLLTGIRPVEIRLRLLGTEVLLIEMSLQYEIGYKWEILIT